MQEIKEFLLSYKQTIITHSIALLTGFVIGYFVFTNTDYEKIKENELELSEIKGEIKQSKEDLTPVEDLTDALQSKDLELEYQDKKIKQLINENNKLRNEKINSISNLSDDDMVKFITEWAKRNGHLPQ
jgi:uncharacterized membrane-anchored protein YhcB (DUF1043 family)